MTICLGKSCLFGLPCMSIVTVSHQFAPFPFGFDGEDMGFLIIAYFFFYFYFDKILVQVKGSEEKSSQLRT